MFLREIVKLISRFKNQSKSILLSDSRSRINRKKIVQKINEHHGILEDLVDPTVQKLAGTQATLDIKSDCRDHIAHINHSLSMGIDWFRAQSAQVHT